MCSYNTMYPLPQACMGRYNQRAVFIGETYYDASFWRTNVSWYSAHTQASIVYLKNTVYDDIALNLQPVQNTNAK